MKKIKPVILLCGLILIGGCYSYKPVPDAINHGKYSILTNKQKIGIPENCKVLTLDTAIKIALKNNPDFISTKHAVSAAWARFYQSLSAYLPEVTGNYELSQNRYYPIHVENFAPGAIKKNYHNNWNIGVGGQWLLFNGLSRTMNMLAAYHSVKHYELLRKDANRILIYAVINSYNQILLSQEQIKIASADLDFQNKMLREAKIKFDAGAAALTDVLNFNIKANIAKNNLIIAKYAYKNAKYALATLMGLTDCKLPDNIKFPDISSSLNKNKLRKIDIFIDNALHNRPDLKAYREALQAAKYNLYSRWGTLLPNVFFFWGYSYSQDKWRYRGHRDGIKPFNTYLHANNFTYGGKIEWTLFNGGKRFAAIREAQALVAEQNFKLASRWLRVVNDVRQAYDNLKRNKELLKIFKENLEFTKKNRDLVEEKYRAGSTQLTRLNEAQRDLVNAQSNLARGIINVLNSKAQLEAATGENYLFLLSDTNLFNPRAEKNKKPK